MNTINLKRHKDTFDRISEKKQQKIIDTAVSEFAARGLLWLTSS